MIFIFLSVFTNRYDVKKNGKMTPALSAISSTVRGIPTLVLVDAYSGEVLTTDGRSKVMADQTGAWILGLGAPAPAPAAAPATNAASATKPVFEAWRKASNADSDTTADATPRKEEVVQNAAV